MRGIFVFKARVHVTDQICGGGCQSYPSVVILAENGEGEYGKGRGRGGEWGIDGIHTIIIIITHDDLLNLSELAHLAPEIFVEGIEVVLQLGRVHLVFGVVGGVLVQVGEEDGLRVRGLDVFAGTAVAVTAGTDFVVEGAVDLVGFGAEDGGEVVGHFRWGGRVEVGRFGWDRLLELSVRMVPKACRALCDNRGPERRTNLRFDGALFSYAQLKVGNG